jgi:hypothetical protein
MNDDEPEFETGIKDVESYVNKLRNSGSLEDRGMALKFIQNKKSLDNRIAEFDAGIDDF